MKKVLTVFLIFAYVNCYMGCFRGTIKDDPSASNTISDLEKSGYDGGLTVMTTDSVIYTFDSDQYWFKNGSIDGIAEISDESKHGSKTARVKLAGSDIISITKVENTTLKVILIGILIAATLALFTSDIELFPNGLDLNKQD